MTKVLPFKHLNDIQRVVHSLPSGAHPAPVAAQPYVALIDEAGVITLYVSNTHRGDLAIKSYENTLLAKGLVFVVKPVSLLDEIAELTGVSVSDRAAAENQSTLRRLLQSMLISAVKAQAADMLIYIGQATATIKLKIMGYEQELPIELGAAREPAVKMKALVRAIFSDMLTGAKVSYSDSVSLSRVIDATEILPPEISSVRITTLPCDPVTKVTMRLHYRLKKQTLIELGFTTAQVLTLKQLALRRGLFLFCGPMGSGKTTTEHHFLKELIRRNPGKSSISIQQPVELKGDGSENDTLVYNIDGRNPAETASLYQEAINALLRQANDYVSLGELRAEPEARAALQLASTGQIIIGTIHAESTFSVISSLREKARDSFTNFSPQSMLGIVSQRLMPILCDSCKEPVTLNEWQELGLSDEHYLGCLFTRGSGCVDCAGIGYTGRQIVADVVAMTEELRTILFSKNSDCERQARDAWQINAPETMASLAYQGLVDGCYSPQDVLSALGEIAPPASKQSDVVRFAYKNTMRER